MTKYIQQVCPVGQGCPWRGAMTPLTDDVAYLPSDASLDSHLEVEHPEVADSELWASWQVVFATSLREWVSAVALLVVGVAILLAVAVYGGTCQR